MILVIPVKYIICFIIFLIVFIVGVITRSGRNICDLTEEEREIENSNGIAIMIITAFVFLGFIIGCFVQSI